MNYSKSNWYASFTSSLTDRKGFVFSVFLGFFVRLVPEILSFPHPIGFDTISYASLIKRGVIWYDWTSFFSTWLFNAILIASNKIVQADPFFLLRIAAPTLYAFNVGGIYCFSRKTLNWDTRKSLIAAFVFTFQLASLRLSWDLYRNMLGLAILLFTLPLVPRIEKRKYFTLFVLFSVLLAFTHLLVSVLIFIVLLGDIISEWRRSNHGKVFKALLALAPFLTVSVTNTILYDKQPDGIVNVISAYQPPTHPFGLVFLSNYLTISDPVRYYPTYFDLVLHVYFLFILLYLLSMPLIVVGFFRNRMLDSLTFALLVGSLSSLITPFCAVNLWNRWMFILVYPFTFYMANGLMTVTGQPSKTWLSQGFSKSRRISRRAAFGITLSVVALGALFVSTPLFFDKFGLFTLPFTYSYFPSTMQYNTIPLRDVDSTVDVIEWLNKNMAQNSTVLVHHAFFAWADLYLDKRHVMVYYVKDLEGAVKVASNHNFDPIYLIWWNDDPTWLTINTGWYGLTVPDYFQEAFSVDRVSVFKYQTSP